MVSGTGQVQSGEGCVTIITRPSKKVIIVRMHVRVMRVPEVFAGTQKNTKREPFGV
jgi:hypothetical protein